MAKKTDLVNYKSINHYSLRMVKDYSTEYIYRQVASPNHVADLVNKILNLSELPNEHFAIVCLNTKSFVSGIHTISVGSLNASIVHPREVFKAALLNNASRIILVHNHPSGDPEPSREDIDVTRRLVVAGNILGIVVLDHVIVGYNTCYSLKEHGLI